MGAVAFTGWTRLPFREPSIEQDGAVSAKEAEALLQHRDHDVRRLAATVIGLNAELDIVRDSR